MLCVSVMFIVLAMGEIKKYNEFPYMYAISKDKKWKAYAYPAYEGGQWVGEMFYLGNKEGNVGEIRYDVKYNGEENYYSGTIKPEEYNVDQTETDERIIKEKRNRAYQLWEFADFDDNGNNKVEIRVHWKESNKEHSQVIKLKMYYEKVKVS